MFICGKILYHEGIVYKISILFLIVFPCYFISINFLGILCFYFLYKEFLGSSCPSTRVLGLYKVNGLSKMIIFYFHICFVLLLNLFNLSSILLISSFGFINLEQLFNQFFLLNSLWIFGLTLSNIFLFLKLRDWNFFGLTKNLILIFYFISATIIFFLNWFLIDRYINYFILEMILISLFYIKTLQKCAS